ncbi:MAG: cytochrome c5 family protein [Betaproteobacteria bacterium]|jgi:cytochrome c5|nr:cytochrome c5 family protein [Betaproteobacteria bacterium]NBT06291.1 cytochrome c5 family protein [Betaproteobacteria bacterium]NBU12489.1 cytochrome c5 family protein [Betaproteobacteria bacterium]NBY52822.1 cytochrome c5 family protein [Betaproteobacteria bacterium]NCU94546.1 cytochrome c5 family protein [Betaproteobacteria bacterium]
MSNTQTPVVNRTLLIIATVVGAPLCAALLGGFSTIDRVAKPNAATEAPDAVIARLKPVGEYVLAAADANAGGAVDGAKVYNGLCAGCHAIGAANAPKAGDKSAWGPRIAKGKDTLYSHALNGFQGTAGVMPARGGNPKLTDDEVKAAVDHLVKLAG